MQCPASMCCTSCYNPGHAFAWTFAPPVHVHRHVKMYRYSKDGETMQTGSNGRLYLTLLCYRFRHSMISLCYTTQLSTSELILFVQSRLVWDVSSLGFPYMTYSDKLILSILKPDHIQPPVMQKHLQNLGWKVTRPSKQPVCLLSSRKSTG